jgi:hypothetical protein
LIIFEIGPTDEGRSAQSILIEGARVIFDLAQISSCIGRPMDGAWRMPDESAVPLADGLDISKQFFGARSQDQLALVRH